MAQYAKAVETTRIFSELQARISASRPPAFLHCYRQKVLRGMATLEVLKCCRRQRELMSSAPEAEAGPHSRVDREHVSLEPGPACRRYEKNRVESSQMVTGPQLQRRTSISAPKMPEDTLP